MTSNSATSLFITGRSGFIGQHLSPAAATHGWQVSEHNAPLDLNAPESIAAALGDRLPDYVVHLAAQSSVADAMLDPLPTHRVNYLGTLNLLEVLRKRQFKGRLLFMSSGEVYGQVAEPALPITETHPAAPRNSYAVSKLTAEVLCSYYVRNYGMNIVIARSFNQIGAGQDRRFVLSDFAAQIAEIAMGLREPILRTGNLNVTRDFLSVRDGVSACIALLAKGNTGETYNLCSGKESQIRLLLQQLIDLSGLHVDVQPDSSRIRPLEQLRIVGDNGKLRHDTGWNLQVGLSQVLQELLDYWRDRLGRSS